MRFIWVFGLVGCAGEPSATPPSSEPTTVLSGTTSVTFGECESDGSYRSALDSGGEPVDVRVEVDADGRIVTYLDNERANCCPNPVADYTGEGSELILTFSDTLGSSGCDCMCVFDFVVTSAPYPAGDYTLEVIYDGESQATLSVQVP